MQIGIKCYNWKQKQETPQFDAEESKAYKVMGRKDEERTLNELHGPP